MFDKCSLLLKNDVSIEHVDENKNLIDLILVAVGSCEKK